MLIRGKAVFHPLGGLCLSAGMAGREGDVPVSQVVHRKMWHVPAGITTVRRGGPAGVMEPLTSKTDLVC